MKEKRRRSIEDKLREKVVKRHSKLFEKATLLSIRRELAESEALIGMHERTKLLQKRIETENPRYIS